MREWIRAFAGVFFAFLGVQSEENRRHDFEKVRFSVFAVAGLILTFCVPVDRLRACSTGHDVCTIGITFRT